MQFRLFLNSEMTFKQSTASRTFKGQLLLHLDQHSYTCRLLVDFHSQKMWEIFKHLSFEISFLAFSTETWLDEKISISLIHFSSRICLVVIIVCFLTFKVLPVVMTYLFYLFMQDGIALWTFFDSLA